MRNTQHRSPGFTLLELVIVMGILAFLTINIAVNIQNAFRARTRIQTKLDDFSRVRDALKIMEKDFNLAFHYRDIEEEMRAELKKAQNPNPTPTPGQPPGFSPGINPGVTPTATPVTDPKEAERLQNRVDPSTQFIGTEDHVNFVTMNTARTGQDSQQADFVEVGYSLKPCRRPGAKNSTQCLMRRESPLVEGPVDEGGEETVLLEDVTEFQLRYFGQGKQDWNIDWNSEANDGATKNNYPQAVEISLTVERGEDGKKKRKVSMQIVAEIRFPNNAPKQNQGSASSGPPAM